MVVDSSGREPSSILACIVFSRAADRAVFDRRRARELGRSSLSGVHGRERRPADRSGLGSERGAHHRQESRRYLDLEHRETGQSNDHRCGQRQARRGVHLHSFEYSWSDESFDHLGRQRYRIARIGYRELCHAIDTRT